MISHIIKKYNLGFPIVPDCSWNPTIKYTVMLLNVFYTNFYYVRMKKAWKIISHVTKLKKFKFLIIPSI